MPLACKLSPVRVFRRILLQPEVLGVIRKRAQTRVAQVLSPGFNLRELSHAPTDIVPRWRDEASFLIKSVLPREAQRILRQRITSAQ